MARPTSDPKTQVIKVRVNEELESKLREMGDNLSGTIRELLEKGTVPKKAEDFVPQEEYYIDEKITSDMSVMAFLNGFTYQTLIEEFHRRLEEGEIVLYEGTMILNGAYDLSKLEDVCHDKNVDVQDAIDRLVREMYR